MKTKLFIMAVIVMIAIGSVVGLAVANGSDNSQSTPSPTPAVDLSQCFPAFLGVAAKPASFQPSISESQAISTLRDVVRKYYYPRPEELPAFTALATFTGEIQDGRGTKVQDLPVWVVVLKDLPDGPIFPYEPDLPPPAWTTAEVRAAIDASTGMIIYGCIGGTSGP